MRTKRPHEKCCGETETECGHIATERNRYFTGKYMTARDFQDEQSYFLSRHRLHNRLLHGWGIVCGLKVTPHPNPDCALRWVVIQPGIAIDCCGRELIIDCEIARELPLPRVKEEDDEAYKAQKSAEYDADESEANADAYAPEQSGEQPEEEEETEGDEGELREPFLVALRYKEEDIEHVPALYSDGACEPSRTEANRVRESVEIVFIPLDEVESDCWRDPRGDRDAPCRDDCGDDLPGPGGTCLDPVCPCGSLVPLALIKFDPDEPERGFRIRMRGRRNLPTPPELLTHISHINWPHGGEVTLAELNDDMGGRLEITFDRKLLPAQGEATGVSAFTFVVQYGGVQRDVEFLPHPRHEPPSLEEDNQCRAVFTIDPAYIDARDRDNIINNIVYVALKCDFILDCHNNPVDGNFLRGLLPTGDGVPGGTFESWFRVVYEEGEGEEEERWQHQRGA